MKQTAIEWLYNLSKQRELDIFDLEQAIEMEKEQIKEGYIMALLDRDTNVRRDAEDYYNETYGK